MVIQRGSRRLRFFSRLSWTSGKLTKKKSDQFKKDSVAVSRMLEKEVSLVCLLAAEDTQFEIELQEQLLLSPPSSYRPESSQEQQEQQVSRGHEDGQV